MFWGDANSFQEEAESYYLQACESIEQGQLHNAIIYQRQAAYLYKRARTIVEDTWLHRKLGALIPDDKFTVSTRITRSSSS